MNSICQVDKILQELVLDSPRFLVSKGQVNPDVKNMAVIECSDRRD